MLTVLKSLHSLTLVSFRKTTFPKWEEYIIPEKFCVTPSIQEVTKEVRWKHSLALLLKLQANCFVWNFFKFHYCIQRTAKPPSQNMVKCPSHADKPPWCHSDTLFIALSFFFWKLQEPFPQQCQRSATGVGLSRNKAKDPFSDHGRVLDDMDTHVSWG